LSGRTKGSITLSASPQKEESAGRLQIDITSPFDPDRFYAMLRRIGANPYLYRSGEQGVREFCGIPTDGKLRMRRYGEAHAWASSQDGDSSIRKAYLKQIVLQKSDGDFIHQLGC
jgi:hypothetical protein